MRTPQQLHSTLVLSFKPKKASRKSIKKMIHYAPLGRLPLSQPRLDQTPRASSTSASQMIDFTLPPPHPLEPSNSVSATPQAISNPSTTPCAGFIKMRKKNKKKNNSYGNDEMANADNNNNSNNNNVVRTKSSKKKRGKGGRTRMREPRFCFKTMSDVDVLDDGYKWRKYGQKLVKNTQYPRSYYRCTRANCRVKKRIERLPEDQRMVITTYEGRHIHSPPHDEDKEQDLAKISWFW
ncbi:probable WRKY transcription factor 12 isoform X2 [Zingiber officinale]|uniref:probable WRKY transcription factor 12 isoform X2 n=1 Tax=Zingiber officinale TaxID=94328 RepID=UPI001C4B5EDF|nr:probable WRKY transcription factor 12 isoform X2 [Zingiber officinale]